MNTDLISQIRILPIDQIVPFEQLPPVDPDLSLSDCHLVRDPFLVAPLGENLYVLLDNVDTFAELISCGLTQIPVQIVGRNEVSLSCARLGLYTFTRDDIVRLADQYPQHLTLIETNCTAADSSDLPLRFEFFDSPQMNLLIHRHEETGCPEGLRLLFDLIDTRGGFQTEMSFDGLTTGLMRRRNYSCLLSLPRPTFEDVEHAARTQDCYPVRIVLAATAVRGLQIDLSVAVLNSDLPVAEKEAYLRDLIIYRHQSARTTSYEGRIYLFNR